MVEFSFEGVCNTKYNSGLSDKWNKLVRKLRLEQRSFWLRAQLGIVHISILLLRAQLKLVMCQTSKPSLTSQVLLKPVLVILVMCVLHSIFPNNSTAA